MSIISTQVKDNLIINGCMRVPQYGTSFAAVVDNTYTLDRWNYGKAGDMVHTITQDTDVPTLAQAGVTTQYSLKVDCTTIDSSIGASDFTAIRHYIEGYAIAPYIGRNLTLSFWVKATKTGIYCITFFNSGADRRFTTEYTISTTNTWEKKIVIMPMNYSGGTWNYTNGAGLKIWFMLACGSDYQTSTINTWQTSSVALATSNQVNACDSTDNNFWLANVKLEPGSVTTKYEPRTYADELRLCQRYFYKIGGDNVYGVAGMLHCFSTTSATVYINNPVPMRVTPTSISYSDVSHWMLSSGSWTITANALALHAHASSLITAISAGVASGLTGGQSGVLVSNNTTSARLYINSEL